MRRGAGAGVAAAGLLLLAACAPIADRTQAALDSASSATASVSLVLTQLDDGAALPPFADTMIGDALTELEGAESDLSQTGAIGDHGHASDRDAALSAIRAAVDAVLAAREDVATGTDLTADIANVDSVTDTLHSMSKALGS